MLYSTRTADAVHILVLIALADSPVTSQSLATSISTNPAHIRKLMSFLRKGGLLQTSRGKAEPVLTRKPEEITLWDIYQIMENTTQILHLDTHTNPDCHEGVHIQLALQENYDHLQHQFEQEMQQITLQKIIEDYQARLKETEERESLREGAGSESAAE